MQLATLEDRRLPTAGRPSRAGSRENTPAPISYDLWRSRWNAFPHDLEQLIDEHAIRSICELGGGANPVLTPERLAQRRLDYLLVDIDPRELAKAPAGYATLEADVCSPPRALAGRFDLVVSRMLLEHVSDGERFHRGVLEMLRPGGLAFHFFPTLYALPFVANWLMSERWSARLLAAIAPRDPVRAGKFPAHYSWCRGPSRRQIGRLERLGFEVLAYRGLFGHGYYAHVPLVRGLERLVGRLLVRHPLPCLTSYAQVLLRKPPRD